MSSEVLIDGEAADLRSLAACNDGTGGLAGLFFSEDLHDIARAKHVCAPCPVRRSCLEGALERREACGVWGGELLVEGRVVAIKRGRGRPPKHRPAERIVCEPEVRRRAV